MKSRWIANPYTHGSGHQTGAAVDLTLVEIDESGSEVRELDMGTKMQEFNARTLTQNPLVTADQRENRELLLKAMEDAGFVNYPEEWWHFSYGERLWAELTGASETKYAALGVDPATLL
jgi:D-alanyl-D-alanine dipeptidase